MNKFIYVILLYSVLFSCKGYQKAKKVQANITQNDTTITLSSNSKEKKSLAIYYSGCAGFCFDDGEKIILNDVFLSNRGPLVLLNLLRMRSDTMSIHQYFQQILGSDKNMDKEGKIKALLATHTHYDHVLDFPYIYHKKLNKDSCMVIGSRGVKTLLKASKDSINEKNIYSVENESTNDTITFKKWFYLKDSTIRILPIISNHAPHFYGIKFYKGSIKKDLKRIPSKAAQYKEGQSLAYLIDYLDSQKKTIFRIYLQGSANYDNLGLPPKNDNKQIDVAIICVASYAYTGKAMEKTVTYLNPRFVILSHWENFFQSHKKLETQNMVVPFTDLAPFLKRFKKNNKQKKLDCENHWILPKPNTKILLNY